MKTQRQSAEELTRDLIRKINIEDVHALQHTINQAQNDPPLGEADGSLDEKNWTKYRDIARAFQHVLHLGREFIDDTDYK